VTDERVRIAAYDPGWPGRFAAQRPVVERLLEPWLAGPVEHIGSTAVPGQAAKPVIDMPVRDPLPEWPGGLTLPWPET
jgi:GrpB-like predicted nucleotidyltransferase (UPF0157 family)